MKNRKLNAILFVAIALSLGIYFYLKSDFPENIQNYFKPEFFNQFGPIAISVELLIAGIYLFSNHKQTNFSLAVFGFTALLDPFFNLTGIFSSMVPHFATVIFIICAIWALWLAFTNTYNLGRISFLGAFGSFLLGVLIELSFNSFFQF